MLKKKILITFLLVFVSNFTLLITDALAIHPVDVFGPKTFIRTTGAPNVFQESFDIPTLLGTFTLKVESSKVSSASIKLNGTDIFTPKDFNQNISFLTKQVTPVLGSNTLNIQLASQPTSSLKITITFLSPVKVTVTSELPEVIVKNSVKFNAVVSGTNDQRVVWSVIEEGTTSAGFGTIDSTGLYTAPDAVPYPPSVTIQAQSIANSYEMGTAAVTVKNPTVTGIISPQGGTVTLEGYASVTFPAGAFATNRYVTVSATASPKTQEDFNATAEGPRLPYEIRINSGYSEPTTSFEVLLNVPDSFIASIPSDYEIHVFAQYHEPLDAPELYDHFGRFSSTFDSTTKILRATLPQYVFTNLRHVEATYETIVIVGAIPAL